MAFKPTVLNSQLWDQTAWIYISRTQFRCDNRGASDVCWDAWAYGKTGGVFV